MNISAASAGTDSYAAAVAVGIGGQTGAGPTVDIGKDGASVTLTVADDQDAISIKNGTLNLHGNISIPKGEINIDGGTANIKGNLTLDTLDRINVGKTNSAFNTEGKLTTTSDQIFTVAASENAASVGELNQSAKDKLSFTGNGNALVLTDSVFTFDYYKNAQQTYTGANAPQSIVMTGKMVELTPSHLGELTKHFWLV